MRGRGCTTQEALPFDSFVYFRYLSFATLRHKRQLVNSKLRRLRGWLRIAAMNRRTFFRSMASTVAAAPIAAVGQASPSNVTPAFPVRERLDQGPFDIDQDEGWRTALFTTPSEKPLRNPGLGLVGYTWEENGPSLAVHGRRKSLEQQIEDLAR